MLEPLTPAQRRYYDAICQYEDDKGYSPSITELQKVLNCGRSSAQEGIWRLREKGYLVRVGQFGESRAYRTFRRHRPILAQLRLTRLVATIKPENSIETGYLYLPGECELTVRLKEAIRCPTEESIQLAINAVAQKTDLEKLEELANMRFS